MSTERLMKGFKHFSQSIMIFVAVSKLGKTKNKNHICLEKEIVYSGLRIYEKR